MDRERFSFRTGKIYNSVNEILCREYGVFALSASTSVKESLKDFFLKEVENDRVLDVIELVFRYIDAECRRSDYRKVVLTTATPGSAIEELNLRFREHGIGYQFENGILFRKDSEILHSEVVKPVLQLLSDPQYSGASEEFLRAHEHYRHSNDKECVNECLKAFESTMKAICDIRGWAYPQTATASKLIEICFENKLIPSFLQSEFAALKSVLESGIPTVRNKRAGHGQGSTSVKIPGYLVSYTLHLTASTLLMLIKAEKELP
jgi:hypothetical protein